MKIVTSFRSLAGVAIAAVLTTAVTVPAALGFGQGTTNETDWEKAAGGKMEFEVASIHPSEPGVIRRQSFPLDPGDSTIPPGGHFSANVPLIGYILFAYKIWPTPEKVSSLVAELPSWAQSQTLVIEARASGNPTKDQMRLMVQSLLAERLNLKVHFEDRDMPVFALVVAKPNTLGQNLRLHSEGPPCDTKVSPLGHDSLSTVPTVYPDICNAYARSRMSDGQWLMGVRNATMLEIAEFLGSVSQQGRPIVDQTGLKGTFDLTLHYAAEPNPSPMPGGDVQSEPVGPTFLEALQDQIGLKLKPTNAPVTTLVIDHVERPSPN